MNYLIFLGKGPRLIRLMILLVSTAAPAVGQLKAADVAESDHTREYERRSRTYFYLLNDENEELFCETRLKADCTVKSTDGVIESQEVIDVWFRRKEESQVVKTNADPLNATYRYVVDKGAQPMFPSGKNGFVLERPYVGTELFFLPKKVLNLQTPKVLTGLLEMKGISKLEPTFSGKWAYSTHVREHDSLEVRGPVYLTSKDQEIVIAGNYSKVVKFPSMEIIKMSGEYLLTVESPRRMRDFVQYIRNSGFALSTTGVIGDQTRLIGHFSFEMKLR